MTKHRTIKEMIGENPEYLELFKRSAIFNKSLHALADGIDEINLVAELSKIIMLQTDEIQRFHEKSSLANPDLKWKYIQ